MDEDSKKYLDIEQMVKRELLDAEMVYVNGILQNSIESGNNKPFWKYVKSPKQETFGMSALKHDCLIYRNKKIKKTKLHCKKDLNLLENWGNTWGIHFNAAKCNIMRVSRTRGPKLFNYSLTGQVLEEVMDAKYLG